MGPGIEYIAGRAGRLVGAKTELERTPNIRNVFGLAVRCKHKSRSNSNHWA